MVREALKAKVDSKTVDWNVELATVERRLGELQDEERGLLREVVRNNFSEEAVKTELAEITSAREIAVRRKQELEKAKASEDWQRHKLEDAEAILLRLKAGIDNATPEIKRRVIENLVQEIKVGKDRDDAPTVRITYAFSRDRYAQGCYNQSDELCSTRMPVRLLWRPGKGVHLLANPDLTLSEAH